VLGCIFFAGGRIVSLLGSPDIQGRDLGSNLEAEMSFKEGRSCTACDWIQIDLRTLCG
jgi:hypothetical protein